MAKTFQAVVDLLLTDDGSATARRLTPSGLAFLLSGFKDDSIQHVELGVAEELVLDLTDALAVFVFAFNGRFDVKLADADTAVLEDTAFFGTLVDQVSRGKLGTGLDMRVTGNGEAAAAIGVWIARVG